ncbi:MAG: hypothetical protein V1816_17930 [Pseudomonadota bacterium]
MNLKIRTSDIFRATLADDCGNLGYVGVAPDGSGYHVVVPVDLQLARGVKAGNRPDDGTPFGGYKGWRYFQCLPFAPGKSRAREKQVEMNSRLLAAWAGSLGIEVEFA